MPQRRFRTCAWAVVILCVGARTANAGIIEIIAEMSGPKMYGFGVDCRLDFNGIWRSCKASGPLAPVVQDRAPAKLWLSLAGGYYFSADKTVNGQDYDRFDVKMLAFDPMIEFSSTSWKAPYSADLPFQIYHGLIGVSYNVLWGEDFSTFANVGLKLRPVGIVVPIRGRFAFDFSYDLRLYPRRFTAEDFGKVPLRAEENGAEAVHAFVFGLRVNLRDK